MIEVSNGVINFPRDSAVDPLLAVLRDGAKRLLVQALEQEVADYLEMFEEHRTADGKRLVVRNGYMPERSIQTGIGDIPIKAPRINDKRIDEEGRRVRFNSKLLPPYLRLCVAQSR